MRSAASSYVRNVRRCILPLLPARRYPIHVRPFSVASKYDTDYDFAAAEKAREERALRLIRGEFDQSDRLALGKTQEELDRTDEAVGEQIAEKLEEGRLPPYDPPPIEHRVASMPLLYTDTALDAHDESHVTKYFYLNEQQLQLLPTSLAKYVELEWEIGQRYLLVREHYAVALKALKRFDHPRGWFYCRKPFALVGKHGMGRSTTLLYWYLVARARGWLCIHINADDFIHDRLSMITRNTEREGIWDQSLYTSQFFSQLLQVQREPLEKITIKGNTATFDWSKLTSNTADTLSPSDANQEFKIDQSAEISSSVPAVQRTLADLVQLAVNDSTQSAAALYLFVSEIRSATEVRTLVTIDNMNVWDGQSDFVDADSSKHAALPARQLALVDAFSQFTLIAPDNGMAVFATGSHGHRRTLSRHLDASKVHTMEVLPYSTAEMNRAVVHYSMSGVVVADVTPQLIARIRGLSGGVPSEVLTIASLA